MELFKILLTARIFLGKIIQVYTINLFTIDGEGYQGLVLNGYKLNILPGSEKILWMTQYAGIGFWILALASSFQLDVSQIPVLSGTYKFVKFLDIVNIDLLDLSDSDLNLFNRASLDYIFKP